MEYFDLYDSERRKTGQVLSRGAAMPEGAYRLVVHACIFNAAKRMLIQRRQPFKEDWAGLWDVSVGGCAVAGEDSRQAVHREVCEELGLDIDFSSLRPALTVNWSHGFDDIYIVHREVSPESLHLQESEVAEVRWATRDEIHAMIAEGTFIPYFDELIDLLFAKASNAGGTHRVKVPPS